MNTKQARPVIEQLQTAGLNMSLSDDGLVFVNNPARLTDDLRALIREHKPMLIEWLRAAPATVAANDTAKGSTTQPLNLSPKLLKASKALDAQIVAAGLSRTPPEQPEPRLATRNTQVQPATQPKVAVVKHVDQAWQPLALAYHSHHFQCLTCITAGKGTRYGPRCGVGACLWTCYQNAIQ